MLFILNGFAVKLKSSVAVNNCLGRLETYLYSSTVKLWLGFSLEIY